MHGMAGSAALLLLTASQASSAAAGLGYVALFGIGSMIGMGALSVVIAVPLVLSARWLSLANSGLQGAVGDHADYRCRHDHRGDLRKSRQLTFADHDRLQLSERNCLRVRLTGNLIRGFNPWAGAFD
jgi:hypothetical protein